MKMNTNHEKGKHRQCKFTGIVANPQVKRRRRNPSIPTQIKNVID
jgi:hypothetical protein